MVRQAPQALLVAAKAAVPQYDPVRRTWRGRRRRRHLPAIFPSCLPSSFSSSSVDATRRENVNAEFCCTAALPLRTVNLLLIPQEQRFTISGAETSGSFCLDTLRGNGTGVVTVSRPAEPLGALFHYPTERQMTNSSLFFPPSII